jgi:hypothetical protein
MHQEGFQCARGLSLPAECGMSGQKEWLGGWPACLSLTRIIDGDAVAVVRVTPCEEGAERYSLGFCGFIFDDEIGMVLGEFFLFFCFHCCRVMDGLLSLTGANEKGLHRCKPCFHWWRRAGSNRRPIDCEPIALPTELRPRCAEILRGRIGRVNHGVVIFMPGHD